MALNDVTATEIDMPVINGRTATAPEIVPEEDGFLCVGQSPYRGVWTARRAPSRSLALYKWAARVSDVDGTLTRLEDSVSVERTRARLA